MYTLIVCVYVCLSVSLCVCTQVAAEKRAEQGLPAADTPHVPVTPSHTHTPQPTESPDTHPPHEVQEIRLVVKADVQGSVEAVLALVQQLSGPYVNIKVRDITRQHVLVRWFVRASTAHANSTRIKHTPCCPEGG